MCCEGGAEPGQYGGELGGGEVVLGGLRDSENGCSSGADYLPSHRFVVEDEKEELPNVDSRAQMILVMVE